MAAIYPSLISADLLNLQKEITRLDPYCAGYHIDIMDNHFVLNLTWGAQFANAIAKATSKTIWVHLMINNQRAFLDTLQLPANSIVSIHAEAEEDCTTTLQAIHNKKWRASLTIKPKTTIETIEPLLAHADHILLMSVEPGFSGQKFIRDTISKIAPLKAYHARIGIDGGVNASNIQELAQAGVDDYAIASGIFHHKDPVAALQQLNTLAIPT